MRVVIVMQSAPRIPYWDSALGALAALDVEVSVVALEGDGPLLDDARRHGHDGMALGAGSVSAYPLAAARLARHLRRFRPDVVHTIGAVPTSVGGAAAVLARRGRRLYHRHHITAPEPRPFPGLANRFAHAVMAVSAPAAAAARAEGVRSPVWIAPNGVAPPRTVGDDERERVRRSIGVAPEDQLVMLVAHLKPGKGHDALIDAVARVAEPAGGRVVVAFVGDGRERDRIAARAADGAVPVVLVGHQEDVWPWYTAADVAVLPSEEESFGLVAAEAMAAGRPLVATAVGGLLEVVEPEVNGLLVPPSDGPALADAIARVLGDPVLAARLGEGGRARYEERFRIERMVEGWTDCYRRLVDRS